MSTVKLKGNASGSGSVTLESPNINSDITLTLPNTSGVLGAVFGTTYSTPSRAGSNTAHQNTGSTHKIVMIDATGNADYLSVSPDNSTWYQVYYWAGGTGTYERASVTLIVPPNHYWRFSGSSYYSLVEIS
jgi:hypothetical protein